MEPETPERFSSQLALAYEALQKKNDEHQRDLEAARRIQLQLLPQSDELPQREEVEFAGYYQSKDRVGGDLYDFIRIGMNSWGFLVADVSGHGVPSALLTMFLKAAFRTRVRWGVPSDQVCREVNAVLNPVVRELGLFATAFFGIVDLESGRLRYSHCGHPPVYLRKGATGELVRLEERGMILGPFDDVEIAEDEVLLDDGDTVLSVTDGILESKNFRDEMYGDERLAAAFARFGDTQRPLANTLDRIRRDWEEFTLGGKPDDDVTLAAFRFVGKVPVKGGLLLSDEEEARTRRERQLAQGLRRQAKLAYASKEFDRAAAFADVLLHLSVCMPSDRLFRAVIARKQARPDLVRLHAEAALAELPEGSTRRELALRILAGHPPA